MPDDIDRRITAAWLLVGVLLTVTITLTIALVVISATTPGG